MWADAYSVYAGTAVNLTGTVALGDQSVVSEHPVALQAHTGDSWQTVATQRLSPDGRAVFTVNPTRPTSYRISYAGAGPLGASTSAPTTIGVTAPSPSPSPSVGSGPDSASGSAPAVSSASGRAARVVALAAAQSGKRYEFGAAGPNAFDCSGLTQYVFRAVGITLPHQANAQLGYGQRVSRAAARPGDLVFFLSGSYAYHVGIYAGGDDMYDAPNPSQRVGRHKIWTSNVVFRRLV
jgi:cell wall-associated NlpC family hydrolase